MPLSRCDALVRLVLARGLLPDDLAGLAIERHARRTGAARAAGRRRAAWCDAAASTPTGTADSTKSRSPQTTGDEEPRPGISTFQRMFFVSLHSSGGSAVVDTPVACGPRHCGQYFSDVVSAVGVQQRQRCDRERTGDPSHACSLHLPVQSPSRHARHSRLFRIPHPRRVRRRRARGSGRWRASSAFTRALIVADTGIVAAGLVDRAAAAAATPPASSRSSSTTSTPIPTRDMVEAGRAHAAAARRSTRIVALGGGSSLDCAKGINFVLTNGGTMRDYRGYGKAARPMLPIDRRADDGRHRQRGAVLRDHLRRRDAREDGVRRSEGGVPRSRSSIRR